MTFKEYLHKENNNLDLIRIICAGMVIIGHSYKLNPPEGQVDVIASLTGFTYSGTLAVQMFFFISGLLVTNSLLTKQSLAGFTLSRVFRLVPGLLFVLLVSVLLIGPFLTSLSASEYFSTSGTYMYIVNNALYRDFYYLPGVFADNFRPYTVNGSLWSLSYEVACYFTLLGLFCLLRTNKLLANLVILAVFIDTLFKLHLLFGWMSHDHPDARLLPLAFSAGAMFAINAESINVDFKLPLGFALLTIIFWKSGMNEVFFMLTSALLMIYISSLPAVRKIVVKHDISYGIYLWGFFVQQTLYHFLGPVNIYVFMIYSLYIASLMGFISFLLVEKLFMRYGKVVEAKIRTVQRH